MGLFSFIGGLLGAGAQKKASNNAETAQLEYLNKALGVQQQQFDQSRADSMPWLTAGRDALGAQRGLMGLDGADPQAAAIAGLQQSPLYQSLLRNGQEALLQNGAATGGLRGGNFARSSMDFGADTLAQVIQQQLSNYGGLSSQGGATGQYLGGLGANYAGQAGSLYSDQGRVRAGGLLTRGGITSGMWNNAGGAFDGALQGGIAGSKPGGGGILGGILKGLL